MNKFIPVFKIISFALAFVAFDLFLNATYYNPAFIVPLYARLSSTGFGKLMERESNLYPEVPVRDLTRGLFAGPRAMVSGTVRDTAKVSDGDWHVNLESPAGDVLVLEIVPEYPLPVPAAGQAIVAWGITRYDLEHRWWEIHPVFGWRAATSSAAQK